MGCFTTRVVTVLLLFLLPEVDGALSLCASCGECSSSYLTLNGYSDEYYYKTSIYYICSSCSDAISRGEMFVYQAYDGTGLFANVYNVYLWFNCVTGRWTRSTVPSGWSSCPDRFSCRGPYPTTTRFVAAAWDACPYSGSTTCSAPQSTPHSHSPHTHSPHTHSPHTHSPSAVHSHSPHTHSPSVSHSHSPNTHSSAYSPPPGGDSQVDHVCDLVNPSLEGISQCTCTETTQSTGVVTECQESIAGLGNVGVRVQLEPCGDPAFAKITYQFDSNSWKLAGQVEADGSPLHFSIPGASLYGAGLYVSVTVGGNAADLSVQARLSACFRDSCNGDFSSFLTAAGFPFPLLEFNDLAFLDSCPAESFSSNIIIIAAAAGGAVAVVLLSVGLLRSYRKKQRTNQNRDQVVTATTVGTLEMTTSSSVDSDPTHKF
mmetsp:Transcript_30722/g.64422  ORF Transcript_30722/g.64422 Transcript_30722/m.64422 type:complete len:430 (+) Transcript_30722:87-1376(+)